MVKAAPLLGTRHLFVCIRRHPQTSAKIKKNKHLWRQAVRGGPLRSACVRRQSASLELPGSLLKRMELSFNNDWALLKDGPWQLRRIPAGKANG